jgi:hypothetical protein
MPLKSSNKGKKIMNNISKIPTSEERHRMIETAAYYRAKKRGFSDGDPVKDWLEAEGEIEASFKQPDAANSSKQERIPASKNVRPTRGCAPSLKRSWLALRIRSTPTRSGRPSTGRAESSRNWGNLFPRRLTGPVNATVEKIGPRWDAFSEKSHGIFEIWKDKGGQFANQAHTALNSWVSRYRDKNGKKKNENDVKS